ncbi:MAG TPA: universal stress protein [Thermoanaerobaculia bacterium]|nr:universal stress protein [Thermoanaerobaculia bacterium]
MKILIAYDASESARAAITGLPRAGLPDDTNAVVLTAADVLPGLIRERESAKEPGGEMFGRARAAALQAMTEAKGVAGEGAERIAARFPAWSVTAEAIDDSPYWAFIERARQLRSDLVVSGVRGRSMFEAAILGSVSQNLLHYAHCSVRVVRGTAERSGRVRMVIGVDGSNGAAAAVSAVAARKWPEGSEARIVTAEHGLTQSILFGHPAADRLPMVEKMTDELKRAGLSVTSVLRREDPKELLLREAGEWDADCIFIGARGLTRIERILLGSVSGAVASRARCTVEVVRPAS